MLYAVLPNGKVLHIIQTVNDFDKTLCGVWTGTMDSKGTQNMVTLGLENEIPTEVFAK